MGPGGEAFEKNTIAGRLKKRPLDLFHLKAAERAAGSRARIGEQKSTGSVRARAGGATPFGS